MAIGDPHPFAGDYMSGGAIQFLGELGEQIVRQNNSAESLLGQQMNAPLGGAQFTAYLLDDGGFGLFREPSVNKLRKIEPR
nr:hypothetical protein [Corynebacterium auriscanis]